MEGCTNKPSGICDCKDTPTPFCHYHAFDHMAINIGKPHQNLQLYFKPLSQTRDIVLQRINQIKRDLKAYRYDAISEVGCILRKLKSSSDRFIGQLKYVEKLCNDIIKYSLQDEIIDIPTENNIEQILKLNPEEAMLKVANWKVPKNAFNKAETIEAINNLFIDSFNPFEVSSYPSVEYGQILLFKEDTKELVTCDLETMQVISTNINASENICYGISICILPDYSLFCYGNCPHSYTGLTFKIDKYKNIQQLTTGKPNCCLSSVYYNGYVYALGGVKDLAERYNLKENKWETCSLLPKYSYSNSWSALYEGNVLITGYYLQSVISYSITQDNYRELPNLSLAASTHKSIFTANNQVYVVEASKNIYESSNSDLTSWQCIGNRNWIANYPMSHVVKFKESIYFVYYPNSLYFFNLKTKQILLVKELK